LGSLLHGDVRRDPILGLALAYWERKSGPSVMPARRDIDATEIPPSLLPYLQITERIEGTGRIRYRLVGTGIVEAYGAVSAPALQDTNKLVSFLSLSH